MTNNQKQPHTHHIVMQHQDDILPPHPNSYVEWEPGQPPGGIPRRRLKPEEISLAASAPDETPEE